jgi:hypothetical protein
MFSWLSWLRKLFGFKGARKARTRAIRIHSAARLGLAPLKAREMLSANLGFFFCSGLFSWQYQARLSG